jgi:signal recognition particle receptor subunit beta
VALFNYATRELSAKIVYYGPGLSGKTTNIEMVHKLLKPEQKGRLISLPTETDRTLFFDFLPIDLGQIKGFKVRFHLYTVPGQVFYNATRRLVLQGVDGVVFVADSQREMANSNMESLKNLMDNLSSYGKKLEELPFVLQYNKRDLKSALTVQELDQALNFLHVPTYEAVAPAGKGVTETLVAVSRIVFSHLRKTLLMPGEMASQEGIMELADDRIQKTFSQPEAEPLEEISEVEEIREAAPTQPEVELVLEHTSLKESAREIARPEHASVFEDLGEIEVERPEEFMEPPRPSASPDVPSSAPPAAAISVDVEGGGLSFLKFESPFVSPEGHAVLPALFLDGNGNPVRVRIRVSMDEERS